MKLANEHTAKSFPVVRTPCFVSVVYNQLAIKTYDQCFSAQTYQLHWYREVGGQAERREI